MGSPLGPTLANIFMDNFEKKHMSELKKLGLTFWVRFVDDTFAIINSMEEADKILEYLNKQHESIKFTM